MFTSLASAVRPTVLVTHMQVYLPLRLALLAMATLALVDLSVRAWSLTDLLNKALTAKKFVLFIVLLQASWTLLCVPLERKLNVISGILKYLKSVSIFLSC